VSPTERRSSEEGYQGPIVPKERAKAMREALPYESITLERSVSVAAEAAR
jgi:hypothetical protein